jgi:hypothetical protein
MQLPLRGHHQVDHVLKTRGVAVEVAVLCAARAAAGCRDGSLCRLACTGVGRTTGGLMHPLLTGAGAGAGLVALLKALGGTGKLRLTPKGRLRRLPFPSWASSATVVHDCAGCNVLDSGVLRRDRLEARPQHRSGAMWQCCSGYGGRHTAA